MGPSGSGKSTLLNIISLIDQPSNGVIKFNKMEVKSDDFIKIYNEKNVSITLKEKSRLFIVVSPIQLSYSSYASQL